MITLCENEQQAALALQYIEKDYQKAPYAYINLKKYGAHGHDVKTWIDMEDGHVAGVYLLYFDCLHIVVWEPDYPVDRAIEMVRKLEPHTIFAPEKMGERILEPLSAGFEAEKTYIVDEGPSVYSVTSDRAKLAGRDDLEVIVDLIITDETYANTYSREILIKQLQSRYDDKFSRFFVIRDGKEIAASVCTYGETEQLAVLGGLVVAPAHRRKGLAAEIWRHALAVMRAENRLVVAIVNAANAGSVAFHEKKGSFPLAVQYKLIRLETS